MAFTFPELDALQAYLDDGGRILILLAEGSSIPQCNINIFLEKYGIVPNSDCLVRTHYYKYFHPKECCVNDIEINKVLGEKEKDLQFVYPFGCTLSVNRPSVIGFTSGITTFPLDRPLAALYCHKSGGRIVAVGSGHMFSDKYIDKDSNNKLREMLMGFLTSTNSITLQMTEHDDLDVRDSFFLSFVRLIGCFCRCGSIRWFRTRRSWRSDRRRA